MSGEVGRNGILGWTGPLAVLVSCAAGAVGGWLCAVSVAGLLREPLGANAATLIGAVAFLPAALVGFGLALVVMSLLLAIVVRKLPDGPDGSESDGTVGSESVGSKGSRSGV